MTDPALFGRGGDDMDLADSGEFALQGRQAGGVDTVVVGEQDEHGLNSVLVGGVPFREQAGGPLFILIGVVGGYNGRGDKGLRCKKFGGADRFVLRFARHLLELR